MKKVIATIGLTAVLAMPFGANAAVGGTIGDFVWEDVNRNGVQDSGEPGIGGVTVNLLTASNGSSIVDSDVTDANGRYLVELGPNGISGASYQIQFVLPAGFEFTVYQAPGGTPGTDSDAGVGGLSAPFALASDNAFDFFDAGLLAARVPEPTSLALLGLGLAGLAAARRRKQ